MLCRFKVNRVSRIGRRSPVSWAMLLCVLSLAGPVAGQSAFPTPLTETSTVIRVLQAAQGDVVLALIDPRPDAQTFWPRVLGQSGRLAVTLNAEPLGIYRPDALLRVTPRTGVNRLEISVVDAPERSATFLFSMMRSAGIPNQLLIVEDPGHSLSVDVISAQSSARIIRTLSARRAAPLAETLAVIEARGRMAIPTRPSTPNWRAGDGSTDSSNESGSDGVAGAVSGSTADTEAGVDASAPTSTSESTAESATESPAESSESDVAADRRSYL